MGRQLTDTGVAALKPKATTYLHPDTQTPGLFVRVLPSGSKAFVVVVRHQGKQIWKTLKGASGIVDARERARIEIERIKGQTLGRPESASRNLRHDCRSMVRTACRGQGVTLRC